VPSADPAAITKLKSEAEPAATNPLDVGERLWKVAAPSGAPGSSEIVPGVGPGGATLGGGMEIAGVSDGTGAMLGGGMEIAGVSDGPGAMFGATDDAGEQPTSATAMSETARQARGLNCASRPV
jgi:hypothetical protein